MRKFEYREPYKIVRTDIKKEYLNEFKGKNFECLEAIITKYGIVLVSQMRWTHNSGEHNFSYFKTVIGGYAYTAFLSETRLSEMQLKWLSTNFMKTVMKNKIQ